MSLAGRAALLVLVLACEKLPLDFLVNVDAAERAQGFGALVLYAQHYWFRFAVALVISLLLFAYARGDRAGWLALSDAVRGIRVRGRWIALHALAVLPLLPLSRFLYGRTDAPLPFPWMVGIWVLCAGIAVVTLAVALAPPRAWWGAARRLGALWLYAAAAAAVATASIRLSQNLWGPTAALTFDAVRHLLEPLVPNLQADPQNQILRSGRFAVQVTEYCSGLEGITMLLAFCAAWLLCFRREYRFPRALLLLPAGVILSFVLNVVRIATLMLIGNAGHPGVAAFGFHSQAGWIAFNCAAGLIAVGSLHSRWLTCLPSSSRPTELFGTATEASAVPALLHAEAASNPTAVYILPFLAIVAAGMVARAASAGFETLYVFRPVAAGAALCWGWRWLRRLDWRCSWRGLLAGLLVFVVWMPLAHILVRPQSMPLGLAALSGPDRLLWLSVRVTAAVTIVPVASELAFRGYLLRRMVAADFEAVRFRTVSVTALIFSSLIFGVVYGPQWLLATLAGLIYGVLLMRTERIGEVVLAHAITGGLVALAVLQWGQWQLW